MTYLIKLKSHPEVKAVILAAFPHYCTQTAYVGAFSEQGQNVNAYWDGGSRDMYAIVELATGQAKPLPTQSHPFYDIPHQGVAKKESEAIVVDRHGNVTLRFLPEGYALVVRGPLAIKPARASVYFNPTNLTKLLPAAL